MFVSNFEREVYETKKLTAGKVKTIARRNFRKYFDRSEDSLMALNVSHIYSWESSGSYHGYGLAELAVEQWRDYFYKKYGHIVDNPSIGEEMSKVWALGSTKTFNDFVVLATGKKLSAEPMLKDMTASVKKVLQRGRERIHRLKTIRLGRGPIKLGASIRMVSGKKLIADNRKSFEAMAGKYKTWLQKSQNNVN